MQDLNFPQIKMQDRAKDFKIWSLIVLIFNCLFYKKMISALFSKKKGKIFYPNLNLMVAPWLKGLFGFYYFQSMCNYCKLSSFYLWNKMLNLNDFDVYLVLTSQLELNGRLENIVYK